MMALYAVHELRLTESDFPEGVEVKAMTGELFQRFQLKLVGCGVAQTAFSEVLAWATQQAQTDAIKALGLWLQQKLSAVEKELQRLEGDNLSPADSRPAPCGQPPAQSPPAGPSRPTS